MFKNYFQILYILLLQLHKLRAYTLNWQFWNLFIHLIFFLILKSLILTCVPKHEPPSHLPPHNISLGHPHAPAPSMLYPASDIDWWFNFYMIVCMFLYVWPSPPPSLDKNLFIVDFAITPVLNPAIYTLRNKDIKVAIKRLLKKILFSRFCWPQHFFIVFIFFLRKITLFLFFFNLYWFCHTLTWIHYGCTCIPKHEPLSHLPPHNISLGHPRAPAPSMLYPASDIDWRFNSYMIVYVRVNWI